MAYWKDPSTLRFILGRTFGPAYLKDKDNEYRPWSPLTLGALAVMGYFTWVIVLFGTLFIAVYGLYRWVPDLLQWVGKAAFKWITG